MDRERSVKRERRAREADIVSRVRRISRARFAEMLETRSKRETLRIDARRTPFRELDESREIETCSKRKISRIGAKWTAFRELDESRKVGSPRCWKLARNAKFRESTRDAAITSGRRDASTLIANGTVAAVFFRRPVSVLVPSYVLSPNGSHEERSRFASERADTGRWLVAAGIRRLKPIPSH